MKSTDLVPGTWYTVRTHSGSWSYSQKASFKGRYLCPANEVGWHKFEVIVKDDGNFNLVNRRISSKSVLEETDDPIPVKGSEEYKAWIQKGIDEALQAEAAAVIEDLSKEICSKLNDFLHKGSETYSDKQKSFHAYAYNGKITMSLRTKQEIEFLSKVINSGLKAVIFNNKFDTLDNETQNVLQSQT